MISSAPCTHGQLLVPHLLDTYVRKKIVQLELLAQQHYPSHVVEVRAEIRKCVDLMQTRFPTEGTKSLILKAIEFALLEQRHLFQKDRSPIIIHELETAYLLASVSSIRDADLFIACLLHHGQFDRQNEQDGNFFTHEDLSCVERYFSKRTSEILADFDSLTLCNTPKSQEAMIKRAATLSPAVQNLWLVDRLAHTSFTEESLEATSRLLDAMNGADQTLKEACRAKLITQSPAFPSAI